MTILVYLFNAVSNRIQSKGCALSKNVQKYPYSV